MERVSNFHCSVNTPVFQTTLQPSEPAEQYMGGLGSVRCVWSSKLCPPKLFSYQSSSVFLDPNQNEPSRTQNTADRCVGGWEGVTMWTFWRSPVNCGDTHWSSSTCTLFSENCYRKSHSLTKLSYDPVALSKEDVGRFHRRVRLHGDLRIHCKWLLFLPGDPGGPLLGSGHVTALSLPSPCAVSLPPGSLSVLCLPGGV